MNWEALFILPERPASYNSFNVCCEFNPLAVVAPKNLSLFGAAFAGVSGLNGYSPDPFGFDAEFRTYLS